MGDLNNIPIFSIVIPTFNRAEYISTAIDSVLNQTFHEWELVIVDDGSTDNTREVVMSFNDNRIHYHYQENRELNAARNKGVDLSHGRFIGFLDDDDYFLPGFLAVLNDLILKENHTPGIYRTGVIIKYNEKKTKGPLYNSDIHKNPTSFILKEHNNLLGSVIHRSVFGVYRFNEKYKLFEDIHFMTIISLKYPLFQSSYYGAIYVRHPETRISKYYIQKDKIDNCIECIYNLFSEYGNDIRKLAGKYIEENILSTNYLMFAEKFLRQRSFKEALIYWAKSFRNVRSLEGFKSVILFPFKLVFNLFKA